MQKEKTVVYVKKYSTFVSNYVKLKKKEISKVGKIQVLCHFHTIILYKILQEGETPIVLLYFAKKNGWLINQLWGIFLYKTIPQSILQNFLGILVVLLHSLILPHWSCKESVITGQICLC